MLEIRHIVYIQSVVRYGSFTKASEALGLTQSALSRSILSLEDTLQVTLLERGRGKLQLTPFGKLVLERGQRILTERDDLLQDIDNLKGHCSGNINAAFEPAAAHLIMGDVLINLRQKHPQIHTNFTTGDPHELVPEILTGNCDIMVGPTAYAYGVDGIGVKVLGFFQASVIVRSGHPLTRLPNVNLGELLHFPYVGYQFSPTLYEQWATSSSVNMTPATLKEKLEKINTDNLPSISKILLETDAFTWGIASFFEDEILSKKLVVLTLPGTPIDIELGIAYQARRSPPPIMNILEEEITKQYRKIARKEAKLLEKIGI